MTREELLAVQRLVLAIARLMNTGFRLIESFERGRIESLEELLEQVSYPLRREVTLRDPQGRTGYLTTLDSPRTRRKVARAIAPPAAGQTPPPRAA
ncbi:MAG TPA: hypothetical protein VMT29_22095 [Steroidobacteraceae bacterium]|nr:hypothetical protein [Steroidobacteraceae bacterium]